MFRSRLEAFGYFFETFSHILTSLITTLFVTLPLFLIFLASAILSFIAFIDEVLFIIPKVDSEPLGDMLVASIGYFQTFALSVLVLLILSRIQGRSDIELQRELLNSKLEAIDAKLNFLDTLVTAIGRRHGIKS